ncbi:MAG: hypothetical protein RI922_1609 [Bacteroidota bacterium]|jgi:hypothetical protein
MKTIWNVILFLLILLPFQGRSQVLLNGTILDEKETPIPNARIFVKNNAELRTIADVNGYYELRLFPGEYFLVYNASGYGERESWVVITDQPVARDIQLFPVIIHDIEDIQVTAKKSNPGREIMLKVVAKRDSINPWNYAHTVDGYIKATEKLDVKVKEEKEKKPKQESEESNTSKDIDDPFEEERKKQTELANNMNLVEVQFTRNYAPPANVKEIRNAYEKRGNDQNLYYTTTVKSNFNFFQNLLHLDDLHQSPVSSPISGPGILSYKYRLEEQYEENGRIINRIKIIPRSTATTTLEGYIWVIDSVWLIQKLELTLNKGNLLVYDYFKITQSFEHPGDSMCVLTHQELDYGVKYKDQTSVCKTVADFSNYKFNATFPPKFFGNEVAVTEKEAYEKDSSYWSKTRTTTLTLEEQKYIIAKDSIRDYQNRKEYIDSVDALFNKVTAIKVLWFGIDHRNRVKKTQWTISSIAATARPMYIAGPRVAPSFFYFKKWENEHALDCYTEASIGFLNKDIKGRTWWRYRYAPFHFGTVNFQFSQDFDAIRSYDAITQIYKRENFIEATQGSVGNSYELFNGFYWDVNAEFSERRSIDGYKFVTLFDKAIPNNEPSDFKTYQAFVATTTISYTPKQKYMREPKKKVLLGSSYPTFYVTYERGIPKLFGSEVDHEYGRAGMMQTFKIGTLGTSSYHITTGKFLSSKNLYMADFKFQRRSDPIWFSNPLYSFQGLDSSLPSKKIFYEGHFVHHDNGAIINKIPFMKKTGIGLVLGAGALYVKEYDWQHYEIFAGLERNFKFSKRRLRIGIYACASDGNKIDPRLNYKVSFAILDDRNMKWNF